MSQGGDRDDESFATAEGDDAATKDRIIDYDMSPAVVCIDCAIDVAVTPREVRD